MLRFVVFDKARSRLGWVQAGDPSRPVLKSARAVLRHNALSQAEFTVDADHHLVAALATPGARVVVEYRPLGGAWRREFSGPVRAVQGAGSPSTRTFTVGDDLAVLWDLVAWPVPSAAITAQADAYWRSSGVAESVVKAIVSANAGRYAQPITTAPDLARGSTVNVSARMVPLADVLFPKVDQAGIGVTAILAEDGSSIVVDCYEKRVHTVALSDRSGVITGDTSYSVAAPTVTRVVVGAGGEGEARYFQEYVNTARESGWGVVREVFRDARDISASLVEEPDRDALMAARAEETIAEGAEVASLSLQLAETDHFRYGSAVLLGDIVQASVAGGPVLTDTVREVEISQTPDDGVSVTPRVGDRASDPDNPDARLVKAVMAMGKGIRNLNAGR